MGHISIRCDLAAMNVDAIHEYLGTHSYWALGIPRETLVRALENSLCFGMFDDGVQIAFARVITDRATYGYLADVYVLESHRGMGLGVRLMEAVCAHPDLQGLRRFGLATRDAHGLYRKFGFAEVADASKHMEIFRPGIYRDE